jgi:predicted DNA-binding mobile mystery protein A
MQAAKAAYIRPRSGWIQAIRTGLGMSTTDLAKRLGVAPSTVLRIEKSEAAGTASLESLNKMAEALGCDFVYAFVPRQTLEQTVEDRAQQLARKKVMRTQRNMALEDQAVQREMLEKLVQRYAQDAITSGKLWKETTLIDE